MLKGVSGRSYCVEDLSVHLEEMEGGEFISSAPVACGVQAGCVSRSRSRDEGCSALRNRLIGSRLQTA
ncbi:hypothetical protein [Pasteuria penetrans]|uniref:hypothetical protein n=1 Tax=Pasteuria penetrans TaxID=86005 RepID=UPI000FB8E3F4|nr:hypothetical protein [Pasteuria penetrans]